MPQFQFLSRSEQLAAHLRGLIRNGRWIGSIPGVPTLAAEFGIDRKTVDAALRLLDREGLLMPQGKGRRRLIVTAAGAATLPGLRIAFLDYEPVAQTESYMAELQHLLAGAGHFAFFADDCLVRLGMDVSRITRLVGRTQADAWLVCSASREVLEWFADQEAPALALFGRREKLPIAAVGPDHSSADRAAARRLIELGHRRIVMISRESGENGEMGPGVRAILEEMQAQGVPSSPYNFPRWEKNSEGLHRLLDELFRVTPPTALIIDEPFLFHSTKDHLAQRGILAPEKVSLVCSDPDPTFAWCEPSIAHVRWDHAPVLRRVVRWAKNIASGKTDLRQTLTKAEFVDGGTVGPAPRSV